MPRTPTNGRSRPGFCKNSGHTQTAPRARPEGPPDIVKPTGLASLGGNAATSRTLPDGSGPPWTQAPTLDLKGEER